MEKRKEVRVIIIYCKFKFNKMKVYFVFCFIVLILSELSFKKESSETCPGYDPNIEFSEQNVIIAKANSLKIGSLVLKNDYKEITLELHHPDLWNNHSSPIYPIGNNGLVKANIINTIKFSNINPILGVGNDWGIRVISKNNESCVRMQGGCSDYINNQFVVTVSKLL